jgi:hypothetical protein
LSADHQLVPSRDDRRRAVGDVEELARRLDAELDREAPGDDRPRLQAAGGVSSLERTPALVARPDRLAQGQADPPVAEVEQMVDRCVHPVRVVGEDARDHDRRLQVAVDDDDRAVERLERVERRRVVLAREGEDQSVSPALLEQPHVLGVELRVALGVGQEHGVTGVA